MAQWHRPGSTQQGSYFPHEAEKNKRGVPTQIFPLAQYSQKAMGGGKGGFHEKVGKIGIFEI